MKAEIYCDEANLWRFRIRAANGRIVAVGEGYTRRSGARNGLAAMARAIKKDYFAVCTELLNPKTVK